MITRILVILAVVLILPFLVNIFGRNVFIYIKPAKTAWVVAASQGMCHLARTNALPSPTNSEMLEEFSKDTGFKHTEHLTSQYLDIFSETRLDPLRPFGFGLRKASDDFDYASVEFPWLLLPLGPLFLAALLGLRKRGAARRRRDAK